MSNFINFNFGESTSGSIRKIHKFPDGEIMLELGELDRKKPVKVQMSIQTSDDIFLLMQLIDILKRQEVVVEEIFFPYLMSMRNDRVMDYNCPFNLKIIAELVNSLEANRVIIHAPHSRAQFEKRIYNVDFVEYTTHMLDFALIPKEPTAIVFPDEGAFANYRDSVVHHLNKTNVDHKASHPIYFKKERLADGNIVITPDGLVNLNDMHIIVIDDLCDRGGTFIKLSEYITKNYRVLSKTLIVSHLIQPIAVELLQEHYDKMWTTNSTMNWQGCNFLKVLGIK